MSDPNAKAPGLLDRTAGHFAAVKREVFENVPAPVVEKMGEQARMGVWMLLLAGALSTIIIYLVFTTKGGDWKLLVVLLVIPSFIALIGANMISTKITAAALGSVGALWRGIKGQAPPTNGAP